MKYSKNFERDYYFYLKNIDNFDFCGTLNPKYVAIEGGVKTAKECFYLIESEGKNIACGEPDLLNKLLLTKSAVNFQIKQWAEGIADGTLLLYEFSQRLWNEISNKKHDFGDLNLVWENKEPVYYKDIETQYGCPEWVSVAVLRYGKKMIADKHLKAA